MSDLEIVKGVPLPARTRGGRFGGGARYPWRDMAVGDCFFVPLAGRTKQRAHANASSVATGAGKRLGYTFETRYVAEKDAIGVWRTA